jgi:hypothetical protein
MQKAISESHKAYQDLGPLWLSQSRGNRLQFVKNQDVTLELLFRHVVDFLI